MCDYSLMNIPNRLATEGEVLVIHKFPSGSIGLASAEEVRKLHNSEPAERGFWRTLRQWLDGSTSKPRMCAVCIPPGGCLRIYGVPEYLQDSCGARCIEEVTFTQTSATANRYRDAIRFRNGREVLLQELSIGVAFQVLSLALADSRIPAAMEPSIHR